MQHRRDFQLGGMPCTWGFEGFPPFKLLQGAWVLSTVSPSHSGVTRGSPSVGLWLHAAWVSGPGLFCTFPAWSGPSARVSGILYPSKTSRIMWPASTNQGHSFHSVSPYPLEIAISEAWVCPRCFSLRSAKQKCRSSRSLKSWDLKRFLYSIV